MFETRTMRTSLKYKTNIIRYELISITSRMPLRGRVLSPIGHYETHIETRIEENYSDGLIGKKSPINLPETKRCIKDSNWENSIKKTVLVNNQSNR